MTSQCCAMLFSDIPFAKLCHVTWRNNIYHCQLQP
jgi:hypothetical protein